MSSLWKLTLDPTVAQAHFEARLRGDIETLRRDARRVVERALRVAAEWRRR